ncbi:hypothetical protein HN51_053388 [Arachis hypogaea]
MMCWQGYELQRGWCRGGRRRFELRERHYGGWRQYKIEILTGTEEENKADLSSTRDKKTPKTQSFKEKKKGSSWLQRQFSRKISHDYESTVDGSTAPFFLNLVAHEMWPNLGNNFESSSFIVFMNSGVFGVHVGEERSPFECLERPIFMFGNLLEF